MKHTILMWTLAVALMGVGMSRLPDMVGAEGAAAAVSEVTIDNFNFSPATVTIAAGTTVHWKNHDDVPHSVVADDKSFKSKVLDTDEEYSYTFTKAGTYGYFCGVHPKMTGTVVVQ